MSGQSLSVVQQVCTTIASADFKSKIAQALPPGVDPDRFVRVALTAIQQNPAVTNGDRASLYNAVIRCAQDGLLPDGKRAALVVFGQAVQYMPMIGGLREILADHGVRMATGVVHKNDHFVYRLGVDPYMKHEPAALDQERGEAIGAWAEAKDRDGNVYLEVMGKQDIENVRAVSRAKNSGPWVQQWGEMARKTVGRRLFKSIPLADQLDERETRIMEAMDADTDHAANTATGTNTGAPETAPAAAQAGPRRPRALDAVAAQAAATGADDAIDGEFREVEPGDAAATGPGLADDPRPPVDPSIGF